MSRISVRTALFGASTLVTAMFLVAVAVSVVSLYNAKSRFESYITSDQALVDSFSEMYAQGLQMGQAIRNIILNPGNPKAYANLDQAGNDYQAAFEQARSLVRDKDDLAETLRQLDELASQRKGVLDRVRTLAQQDTGAARELLNQSETPLWRQLKAKLLEQRAALGQVTRDSAQAALASADRMSALSLGLSLIATLVGAGLMLFVVRTLYRQLGGEPDYARAIARRIAMGDLTERVVAGHSDSLLGAMQEMVEKLIGIISQVRQASNGLTSASDQVSATSQSLSQATSQQAASVEETSSSVEQMSSSVGQNADNAKVTDTIAAKAAKDAHQGGEAVKETVQAMQQIASKIGIVDDIAYQTNLLALNAAIEAARAGEHGKGFAVVAAEVRKLAERSQLAAREIGELAADSVGKAERAGTLLAEIVPSILKTSSLVQGIAAASEEQSAGVGQINGAMGQLNQITQQNASASEELAATAEEMGAQAHQLQQVMQFFKIETGSSGRP